MHFEYILFYDFQHHFQYILTPLFRYSLFIFVLYIIDVYGHILQDCFKTRPNSLFSHIFLTSQRLKISSFSIISTIFFSSYRKKRRTSADRLQAIPFQERTSKHLFKTTARLKGHFRLKTHDQPPGEQLRARHSGLFWHIFRHTCLIFHHLELFRKIRQFCIFY